MDRGVIHTGANVKSNEGKSYGKYFEYTQEQLSYILCEFKIIVEKYSPCKLVFEGLSFGSKGDRVFSLGGLFYYVTTSLVDLGLITLKDIITIPPTSVKKVARDCLPKELQYERDKKGEIIYLKSKKPKLKKMDKSDMCLSLSYTDDVWILDGFSSSSKKIPTGVKDLPDAYFIGRSYFKTN